MKMVTPFLWFNDNAEEAAKFYVSIFPKSKIIGKSYYPKGTPGPEGSVMTVEFELNGHRFTALNGGPIFRFTEAVSFAVHCKTQKEIDYYWKKLTSKGGMEIECGWLKDRYGLSWQIVYEGQLKMLLGKDKKKTERIMQAVMSMKKPDIAELKKASKS